MSSSFSLKAEVVAPAARLKPQSRPTARRKAVPSYVLASALGLLGLSFTGSIFIDAEMKGHYAFIFGYLTLPVLGLCYGIPWLGMTEWRRSVSLWKSLGIPVLVALTILFTCGGLVNYANALLGSGATVRFSGPITKLSYTSGRSGRGYYLVMSDTGTSHAREFRINRQEYSNLRVGYAFMRTMKQGGLGYAYSWRH